MPHAPECRLIFEALHSGASSEFRQLTGNLYLPPEQQLPHVGRALFRLLSGLFGSRYTDAYDHSRFPTYRRLACRLSTFSETPWRVHGRSPDSTGGPLGRFLAQPNLIREILVSSADSVSDQAFITSVYEWCLETSVAIHGVNSGSVLVVFYESLVKDPEAELSRIRRFLRSRSPGLWRHWSPDFGRVSRPSAMSFPSEKVGEAGTQERVSSWRSGVPEGWIRDAVGVVTDFGLGWLYGDELTPVVSADEVLGRRVV